ncbi:hypothetical protein CPB85DRAFT_1430608 [Mucidula mucida]|nr:hypothetical protein CPB85DRAFT_1430608 [Mucidula mucida]
MASPSSTLRLQPFALADHDHPPKTWLDEADASEWEELKADFQFLYSKLSSRLRTRFAHTAVHACCCLQNEMVNAAVSLPVAWSTAMVYHAQSTLSAADALSRAVFYFVMCFGIKCLIMTILDSDIDAQVERTKKRAIPRGAISTEFTLGVSLAYNFLRRHLISATYSQAH